MKCGGCKTNAIASNPIPFFVRSDWLAAGVVWAVSLFVYMLTLAPTVTLEHSGVLAVGADHLGIGRVPGYPVWHLCGKLFTSVFSFVRYRGHPNPAWALNFMSALFGSMSSALVALLVSRVGRELASGLQATSASKAAASGIAAGLLLAFSHVMWSQSVITETHTLTLFFFMLFFLATLAWLVRRTSRLANLLALVFGVGVAQSELLVLLIPSLVLALAFVDKALCRDVSLTAISLCLIGWLSLRQSVPSVWVAAAAVAGAVLVLGSAARFLPRGRLAASMLTLVLCGLLLYAYLPIASEGNPPINWGYPRTWEGFKHVISRGQYEKIVPTNVFAQPQVFLGQVKDHLRLLSLQFSFPLVLLGLLPIIRVSRFRGAWLHWGAVCLLGFCMFSIILLIGASPTGDIQDAFVQRTKFIPSFALWSLFIGCGIMLVLDWLERLGEAWQQRHQRA